MMSKGSKAKSALTDSDMLAAAGQAKEIIASEEEEQDPKMKKLIELGYDISILDADPQLAEALLASANLQDEKEKEEERKKKEAEEEEKRRKEEERLKEQKRKELEELKKKGLKDEKIKYQILKVYYGSKQIQEATDASRTLFNFLNSRIFNEEAGDFFEETKAILKLIHADIKATPEEHVAFPDEIYAS